MYEILRNVSLLWATVHVIILFVFMYKSRYEKRKSIIIICAVMVPIITINMWLLITKGVIFFCSLMTLSITLPSFILFYFLSQERDSRSVFTFCITDTFAFWIIVATSLLDNGLGATGWALFLSRLIIFPAVGVLVYKYFKQPYRELQENVKSGWGYFSLIAVLYYLLLLIASVYPTIFHERPDDYPNLFIVILLMPLTYIAMFKTLRKQLAFCRLSAQYNLLETQLENQETIRKLNHNIKAYINTLSALIEEGKFEEAKHQMEQLTRASDICGKYCENPYFNATLCHFACKFNGENLLLYIDALQVPEIIVHYSELCLILSNALDNAFEALSNLDSSPKSARIQIKQNGNYLLIRVQNTCDRDLIVKENFVPKTKKTEKGHGYGIATIMEISQRLGGCAVCYARDGCFTIDISVKL